jgi:hypothetical protein
MMMMISAPLVDATSAAAEWFYELTMMMTAAATTVRDDDDDDDDDFAPLVDRESSVGSTPTNTPVPFSYRQRECIDPKRKASNPTKQTSEAQLDDDDDDVDEANAGICLSLR